MHRGIVHNPGESPGELYIFPHLKRLFIQYPEFLSRYDKLHKKFLKEGFEYERKDLKDYKNGFFEAEFLRQKKEIIGDYVRFINKSYTPFVNTEGWPKGTLVEVDHEDEEHTNDKPEDKKSKQAEMEVIDPLPFYNPRRGGGGFTDFEKIVYNLISGENFFKI